MRGYSGIPEIVLCSCEIALRECRVKAYKQMQAYSFVSVDKAVNIFGLPKGTFTYHSLMWRNIFKTVERMWHFDYPSETLILNQ